MARSIQPIITVKGIEAMGSLGESGAVRLKISHIGISEQSFDAKSSSVMPEDTIKYEIADSKWQQGNRLNLNIAIRGDEVFNVGSIGVYTDSGVLFAVESKKGEVLTNKLKHDELLIFIDLLVSEYSKNKIEVVGSGERLNLSVATEFSEISGMFNRLFSERQEDRELINKLKEQVDILETRLKWD